MWSQGLVTRCLHRPSITLKLVGLVGFSGLCLVLLGVLSSCALPRQVILRADGTERKFYTTAYTVHDVLKEQGVELGRLDRAEPDVWEEIDSHTVIEVIRVEEETEVELVEIPFERRTVRNRGFPEGESRLIQPGENGVDEVVYRITYENGQEVSRVEVRRRQVREPVDEIVMVGSTSQLPSVPITGTIAYISSGNAWVMRHNSSSRRPLTASGDLDHRVFALSPDGTHLLYSRGVAEGPPTPLNSLWMITTTLVGEEPMPLHVEGVLHAEWRTDGQSFVYSTAERTVGAPGWKAHDDLHIFSLSTMTNTQTYRELSGDAYSWWGINFAPGPDPSQIAYSTSERVALLDPRTGSRQTLIKFPVFHTYSEWVWVPSLSWSPDARYLAVTAHGEGQSTIAEESPVFDVWVLGVDNGVRAKLVPHAGMWAMPSWSPMSGSASKIVYGQARDPNNSQNSLYDLFVVDRDGSNDRPVFPTPDMGLRVPQVVWSPDVSQLLFVKDGDIYLFDTAAERVHALTDDGYSGSPRWSR